MISISSRKFMNIRGRKFIGKKVGFDKSKVRCYTCQASNSGSNALVSTTTEDGSFDWSLHLEDNGTITQAFMIEISALINDDQEEKMETEQEIKEETVEVKEAVDQTKPTKIKEDGNEMKVVEDEKRSADEEKIVADFAAFMADLGKATGGVGSKPVSLICLSCSELRGTFNRLSTHNQSLLDELNNLKESNFLIRKKVSRYLKKIKSCEAEVSTLTSRLKQKLQLIDLAHETTGDKTK
ncbi:hypothetical protein Hanom_Chr10g00961431 [Helianthus anomalus]